MTQASHVGLRRHLMAASCALLGATAARGEDGAAVRASGLLDGVTFDSGLAYYHEDGRIQAIEPVVAVSKTFANGDVLGLDFTFDSLSGSSPNGALPSHAAQTFSSPSGKPSHRYTTAAGQLPVDPNYQDDRVAVAASLSFPVTRVTQMNVGAKISGEDDFLSATVNASIAQDFNQKNTTVSVGIYNEFDSLRPIGGTPNPGSDYALAEKTGNETKDGVGVVVGVTQVMTRIWLTEFNMSLDRFHGYLNDPYKFLSVLDDAGNTVGYQYERRPGQRVRKSGYWENRVAAGTTSAGLSLRYMSDDWGVRSETAELHLRWNFSNDARYLQPNIRWYRQTAASFYTPWLTALEPSSSAYQSSDFRLGAFYAVTYGLKYAQRVAPIGILPTTEFNVRLEYYQQTFTSQQSSLPSLQGLNLQPALKAILLQIGWRF